MSVTDVLTRRVQISQTQATALLSVLESTKPRDNACAAEFAEIREQLSEALWLSTWSRNHVTLELGAVQLLDLTTALGAALADSERMDCEVDVLRSIVHQFSTAATKPSPMNPTRKGTVGMPGAARATA